ncbi:protein kinase [Achlya hypogyna]|uniref:Protein kinase n=1 Tax=Achlya hypogyna TaxID=1202772 RepID=A0A1V9Y5I3_ACHHY|nr:protein kinase [Achlya hypogyna]
MGCSVLGGNRANRRTVVFYLCAYLHYAVFSFATAVALVVLVPWALMARRPGDDWQQVYFDLVVAYLRIYWRAELAILSIYETQRTRMLSAPPVTFSMDQVLKSLVYIFAWKVTITGPLSLVPVLIWGLGIYTVINAPPATYDSGGLTIEVLVKWSFFLLAGLAVGQILCVIIVSVSIGFYAALFPESANDERLPLSRRDIAISVYNSTASEVQDTFGRVPPSPTKPSTAKPLADAIRDVPASPLPTPSIAKPLVVPQPSNEAVDIAPSAPLSPTPAIAVPPTEGAHSSPTAGDAAAPSAIGETAFFASATGVTSLASATGATPPVPVAALAPAAGTAADALTPPLDIQVATSVEEAMSPDEEAELAALEKSIEDYKHMETNAKNNKLRRKLEKERKALEERRQKLLERAATGSFVVAGAHMSPAGAPSRGPISIMPTYTAGADAQLDDYGSSMGYTPFHAGITYGSFTPGSVNSRSPIYRNWLVPPPSPPVYDAFDEPPPEFGDGLYGTLSPATSLGAFVPGPKTRQFRLYRSLAPPTVVLPDDVLDAVRLTAYAPGVVAPRSTFTFGIWAYLVNQREAVHEEATADGGRQVAREIAFGLRRGALIHVTLEVPAGFRLDDDKPVKPLPWEGRATKVDFAVACDLRAPLHEPVLFKAKVVVGTKVMILRAYVYVAPVAAADVVELEDQRLEILPETFHEIPFQALEMKELVGRGNFGDAYRASYNGQDVVVKTIRSNEFGENQDQIVKEFRHEAAVLSMFGHHPSIVPFVGASTDIALPLSLVTQYLPFGSLESQVVQRALSVREKETILCDAAAGFLNIHEGGFIHRDIAARNCLVDDELRGKVCDFGMCRRVNSYGGNFFNEGVGPLKYMAPESLSVPHAFSYRSDSYSFGVLMWETFTESKPFPDMPAYMAAAHVIGGGRLALGPQVPLKYHELIEACFHDDPTRRPSMAAILQALLPA